MSDSSSDKSSGFAAAADSPKSPRRFPWKLTGWTLFLLVALTILHTQSFWLNEQFNMNMAIPWLASLALVPLTVLAWGLWLFFFQRSRLLGTLVFCTPILFFTFYYPNFLGDADFRGFKARFWQRDADLKLVQERPQGVDLTTTTEFDFPQFLGVNRDGKVTGDFPYAQTWSTEPELVWKIDIGEGWSGFAIVNGFAVTQEQRGADECVTCYDVETGELQWIYAVPRRLDDVMAMGKVGPRATPTIHEGKVYATSGTGVLDCLDGATGKLEWSADVPKLVGIKQISATSSLGFTYTNEDSTLAWGRSASPLIVGDKVVVPAGGPAGGEQTTLIAFDKNTGEEVWRGGQRGISYGSPTLARVGGKEQILLVAERDAVGHDPETGRELWSFPWAGNSNGDANCSQVTVVDEDRLILSKGYGAGGALIRPLPNPLGEWSVKELNRSPRVLKTKLTNPVLHNGFAFALSDGFLTCADVDSLDPVWRQRGRFGNGQLLLLGSRLLVHTEDGRLEWAPADQGGYQKLGSVKTVDGICWNTIAVYKDLVVVRSELQAACLRLPISSIADGESSSGLVAEQP